MSDTLDNPIWNALNTGNKSFANGSKRAQYIKRDVGWFAGLQNNSEEDLLALHGILPAGSAVILFTPTAISIPSNWNVQLKKDLLQMEYLHIHSPTIDGDDLIALHDKDIPAMIELTALTKPGPFFSRTIDFGNYEGIFTDTRLVAMAGQRLQPDPYTEVSAVCTHPEHTGKGYAARLVASQVNQLVSRSRIPFLHVYPENFSACKLYEKLGFTTRKQMLVYVLERQN
jgi:ribosomal protein S18 acetylase RimI-like enzyme